jgi:hypothetical protein
MKKLIIGITTSIAVTTSITLFAVNIGEISIFTQNITYNITNSRGENRQKDRDRKPETDKNRRPKNQTNEIEKAERDTTENEEEIFNE